jgi:hypothetical protein
MKVYNNEIQQAFKIASEAVKRLEDEIKKKHTTPVQNIRPADYDLIGIPSGYIRFAGYFRNQFNLTKLIKDTNTVDNIAYALMQNDLNNYLIHRIGVFGIVKTLFYKSAIINIHSIIEAILYSSGESLHSFCRIGEKICKKSRTCPFYIKSVKGQKFNNVVQLMKIRIEVEFDIDSINFLKSLRDNIHIQHIGFSEWKKQSVYTYEHYVMGLKVLSQVKDELSSKVDFFKDSRKLGCTNHLKSGLID